MAKITYQPPRIDESNPRVLRFEIFGHVADDDAHRVFGSLLRYIERGEPWLLLSDASKQKGPPSPEMRKKFASFIDTHRVSIKETCLGFVFVYTSVLNRMAIKGLSFMIKLPMTITTTKTLAEAESVAASLLDDAAGKRSAR